MRFIRLWLMLIIVMVVSGSVLLAQLQGSTDEPAELPCDVAELILAQRDLAASLENFRTEIDEDPTTSLETLYNVGVAYQEMALDCGHIPENIGALYVGSDIDRILTALENVSGDPLSGQLLYNSVEPAADGAVLGCSGCHENPDTAPLTEGTWTRWDEQRRLLPQFTEKTFAEYVVSSIIDPWSFTVEDYPENGMPNNFGNRLSYQNLADLISYLESQDQLLD